ncbi:MAG: hypothetical protein JNL11_15590 [Bdellovibrionaceae bacterium]|nr:hypothetical protein [Pseudobdellovibrionaceae bacterium]
MKYMLDRRDFHKILATSVASVVGSPLAKTLGTTFGTAFMGTLGIAPFADAQYTRRAPQDPISKLAGFSSTAEFTGDEPDPNHDRFWNVDGYIQKSGGIPSASESQNVVVVGGGLSGLIAGY